MFKSPPKPKSGSSDLISVHFQEVSTVFIIAENQVQPVLGRTRSASNAARDALQKASEPTVTNVSTVKPIDDVVDYIIEGIDSLFVEESIQPDLSILIKELNPVTPENLDSETQSLNVHMRTRSEPTVSNKLPDSVAANWLEDIKQWLNPDVGTKFGFYGYYNTECARHFARLMNEGKATAALEQTSKDDARVNQYVNLIDNMVQSYYIKELHPITYQPTRSGLVTAEAQNNYAEQMREYAGYLLLMCQDITSTRKHRYYNAKTLLRFCKLTISYYFGALVETEFMRLTDKSSVDEFYIKAVRVSFKWVLINLHRAYSDVNKRTLTPEKRGELSVLIRSLDVFANLFRDIHASYDFDTVIPTEWESFHSGSSTSAESRSGGKERIYYLIRQNVIACAYATKICQATIRRVEDKFHLSLRQLCDALRSKFYQHIETNLINDFLTKEHRTNSLGKEYLATMNSEYVNNIYDYYYQFETLASKHGVPFETVPHLGRDLGDLDILDSSDSSDTDSNNDRNGFDTIVEERQDIYEQLDTLPEPNANALDSSDFVTSFFENTEYNEYRRAREYEHAALEAAYNRDAELAERETVRLAAEAEKVYDTFQAESEPAQSSTVVGSVPSATAASEEEIVVPSWITSSPFLSSPNTPVTNITGVNLRNTNNRKSKSGQTVRFKVSEPSIIERTPASDARFVASGGGGGGDSPDNSDDESTSDNRDYNSRKNWSRSRRGRDDDEDSSDSDHDTEQAIVNTIPLDPTPNYFMSNDEEEGYKIDAEADDDYWLSFPVPWNVLPQRTGRRKLHKEYVEASPVKLKDSIDSFLRWRNWFIPFVHRGRLFMKDKMLYMKSCIDEEAPEHLKILVDFEIYDATNYRHIICTLQNRYGDVSSVSMRAKEMLLENSPIQFKNLESLNLFAIKIEKFNSNMKNWGISLPEGPVLNSQILNRLMTVKDLEEFTTWNSKNSKSSDLISLIEFLNIRKESIKMMDTLDPTKKSSKKIQTNVNVVIEKNDKCDLSDEVFAGPDPGQIDLADMICCENDYDTGAYGLIAECYAAKYKVDLSEALKIKIPRCELCDRHHFYVDCAKFKGMSLGKRRSFVMKLGLCYLCLRPDHGYEQCPKKRMGCGEHLGGGRRCDRQHHRLLHYGPKRQSKVNYEPGS